LVKADELVRHFGLAKTTVADIAAALSMSPANIYKSFSSRDAIIEAVAEEGLAELKRTIESAIASSSGALARIDSVALAVFHCHNQYFRHEPQMFQLLFTANAEHWDCVRHFKRFLLRKITETIEAGSRSGEFHISEVGAAARVLIDCLAVVIEPTASPDPDNKLTEKRVHALVNFLGRALSRRD